MIIFKIWIPVFLGLINMVLYLHLVHLYINDYDLKSEVDTRQILKAPLFSLVLETIIWLPNLIGYIDELLGKKKNWLTR
nr:hypothetical protein BCU37_13520 [Vibrio splendidus]